MFGSKQTDQLSLSTVFRLTQEQQRFIESHFRCHMSLNLQKLPVPFQCLEKPRHKWEPWAMSKYTVFMLDCSHPKKEEKRLLYQEITPGDSAIYFFPHGKWRLIHCIFLSSQVRFGQPCVSLFRCKNIENSHLAEQQFLISLCSLSTCGCIKSPFTCLCTDSYFTYKDMSYPIIWHKTS